MDMQKISAFLAELRKERKLTQEDLGEKIGVTNKTVSRWENGNYLPPVEILQLLSNFYNISINEILSGKRLNDAQYKENAEKNIVTALNNSTASFNDKSRAYRKNGLKSIVLNSSQKSSVFYRCLYAAPYLITNCLNSAVYARLYIPGGLIPELTNMFQKIFSKKRKKKIILCNDLLPNVIC